VAGIGLVLTTVLNPVGISGKTYEQWQWLLSKLRPRVQPVASGSPATEVLEPIAVRSKVKEESGYVG
jgi:hypothetical protein